MALSGGRIPQTPKVATSTPQAAQAKSDALINAPGPTPGSTPAVRPPSVSGVGAGSMGAVSGAAPGATAPYATQGLDFLNNAWNQAEAGKNSQNFFNNQQFGYGQAASNFRGDFLNQQDSFTNQGYQNNLSRLGLQNQDVSNQQASGQQRIADFGTMINNQNQLFGNNAASLAAQLGQIDLSGLQKTQAAKSAGVAGGFGFAPGVQTGINQIKEDTGYARTLANLSAAKTDIGIRDNILSTTMRQNVEKDQLKTLDIKAQELGLDSKDLFLGLQKALAQTGLERFTNVNDLLKLTSSKNASEAALAQQTMQQLAEQVLGYTQAGWVGEADLNAYNAQHPR